MEDSALSKHTRSFGLSVALCAVLNALLVIARERSQGLEDWMRRLTGNAWITHVAMILLLFALLGLCLARANRGQGPALAANRLSRLVCWGVIAGVLIILGFYALAD